MSKTAIQIFATALFFGSFVSIFVWAFFGVTWWAPFHGNDIRELAVYMFHMLGIAVPAIFKVVRGEWV